MKVYEATVIDKCASPSGEEPVSFESHIAVDDENDGTKATDWELFYKDLERETGFTDEDIHYYFTEDEFNPVDGEIETEEWKCLGIYAEDEEVANTLANMFELDDKEQYNAD